LPPLRPADRPRLRAQQCTDGVDFTVRQGAFSGGRPSWHIVRAVQKRTETSQQRAEIFIGPLETKWRFSKFFCCRPQGGPGASRARP
jgi:hypothetical protein